MAGLYDLDVDAQVVDDLARKWDDPDNAAGIAGTSLALTPATITVTAQTVAPSAAVSLALTPPSVTVTPVAPGITLVYDPPSLAVSMAGNAGTLTWSASPTPGVTTYDVFHRTPSTLAVFTPGVDTALATAVTSPYVSSGLASGSHDWQVFGVVASTWTPASISNLIDYWKADDAASITQSGGAVSQWNGQVNGKNFVQASGTLQPLTGTNTINGLNALTFDGSNDVMTTGTLASVSGQPVTLMAVARNTAGSGQHELVMFDGNDGRIFCASGGNIDAYAGNFLDSGVAWGTTNAHQVVAELNGASSNIYVDGGSATTGNAGVQPGASPRLWVGNYFGGGTPWAGYVAEIVAVNGILSSGDRTSWNAYTLAKWGV